MDLVLEFMTHFPEVKIVYEWRDPRGILNSRWTLSKKHTESNFTLDTDILCEQINFDLDIWNKYIRNTTTDSIIVKYENLAIYTQRTVVRLYNDLGIGPVPRSVSSWILRNSHGNSDNDPMSTSIKNSSAVAGKWKDKLPPNLLYYITRMCHRPLFDMGYDRTTIIYK
jgi:hypothetical protein